jgi:hypothetical protein
MSLCCKFVVVDNDDEGNLDLDDLTAKIEKHRNNDIDNLHPSRRRGLASGLLGLPSIWLHFFLGMLLIPIPQLLVNCVEAICAFQRQTGLLLVHCLDLRLIRQAYQG